MDQKERRENVNQIELQHQIISSKSKWEIEAQYTTKICFKTGVVPNHIYSDTSNGIYEHSCV